MTAESRSDGLQDFVARNLVRGITSGELPPGTRLSPARLAEDLGVSHIPVREALAALEAAGQVRRIPRVGYFVAELSVADIEDIYRWRQVLEDEAHRIAVPILSEEDLARMRALSEQDNRAFHFIPFQRANSEHLLRFITQLWDAAARYQSIAPGADYRQHNAALLTAFEARDVAAVHVLMAADRCAALKSIRQGL
ncbi:MAG TPA: GntR family transcriptional regulator [Pseudonocardiaceae bacterium]|nr:GntR family transcriptional regulator [Pseudonocardiaceae bacterium]